MLKERLFGLANNQGNHGEDVKEFDYYLDNTPTHSYMKYLYKYPQAACPHEQLVRESPNRGRDVAEFEITDTDLFDEDRYWDAFVEYAKDDDEERLFRSVSVTHEKMDNSFLRCSTTPAPSYPPKRRGAAPEPVDDEEVAPTLMFTENETNLERLYDVRNKNGFAKDAFHDEIIIEHRMEKDRAKAVKKTGMVTKTVKKMVKGPSTPKARQHDEDKKLTPPSDSPSQDYGEEAPRENVQVAENAEPGHDDEEEEHEIEEETEVEEGYWEVADESTGSRPYVKPEKVGTKAAAQYVFSQVPGGGGCAVV
ncbi:hypothetical protein CF326_g7156, partial [Tilletia indica]